ncbi:PP85 [Orf virus]|uniref:PP85 n=1 Tax=Orf virus TaxID=10258 RepID=F1AX45_ORFV|nr:PP85 [Orf virus]
MMVSTRTSVRCARLMRRRCTVMSTRCTEGRPEGRVSISGTSSPRHTNSKFTFSGISLSALGAVSATISVWLRLMLMRLLNSLKPSFTFAAPLFSVVWKLESACCVNFSQSTCADMMPTGVPPPSSAFSFWYSLRKMSSAVARVMRTREGFRCVRKTYSMKSTFASEKKYFSRTSFITRWIMWYRSRAETASASEGAGFTKTRKLNGARILVARRCRCMRTNPCRIFDQSALISRNQVMLSCGKSSSTGLVVDPGIFA